MAAAQALETECQNELKACREASGQPPAPPTAAAAAAAAAVAAATADAESGRGLSEGAGSGCGARVLHEYLRLAAALLLGVLLGSTIPSSAYAWLIDRLWMLVGAAGVGGAELRRRTPHVEEMRGWMPSTVVSLDDMKLS